MTAFTLRVPEETAAKLDRLAEKLDRPSSHVAMQAIEDFIAHEEWQIAEIEAGVTEAEMGDFASDEDLAAVIAKYVLNPKASTLKP